MTNEGHTYIIEKIDADEYTIDKAGYKRNVTIILRPEFLLYHIKPHQKTLLW